MEYKLKKGDTIQCEEDAGIGIVTHKQIYTVKNVEHIGNLTFFDFDIFYGYDGLMVASDCLERADHLHDGFSWIIKEKLNN